MDDIRERVGAARRARAQEAVTERAKLVAVLVDVAGYTPEAAAGAVDRLISTVRDADSDRVLLASMERHDRVKYAGDAADWLRENRFGAPITQPEPITVHIDWTHREGERITGLMLFSLRTTDNFMVESQGRKPQFLLTGGTRRKTMTVLNDYNGVDQFHTKAPPEEAARQAADWLGLNDRPLNVEIHKEY